MNQSHSQTWFAKQNGVATGPYSSRELRTMIQDGRITPDTPVRNGGTESWVLAKQLRVKTAKRETAVQTSVDDESVATRVDKPKHPEVTAAPAIGRALGQRASAVPLLQSILLLGGAGLLIVVAVLAFRTLSSPDQAHAPLHIVSNEQDRERQRQAEEQGRQEQQQQQADLLAQQRQMIDDALGAEDQYLELLKHPPSRSKVKKTGVSSTTFLESHSGNPLVLRLAAIDAMRREQNDEANRLATACLGASELLVADHPLRLPDESVAELHFCIAVAGLAQGQVTSVYRRLQQAATLDPDEYTPILESFERAIRETMPSPNCLALAKNVTVPTELPSQAGVDIDIDGTIVIQVPATDVPEEMRVRVKKLYTNNSLLVEYDDPLTGKRSPLLFPFGTVSNVYREVESERWDRMGVLHWIGYDTKEIDIRMGDGLSTLEGKTFTRAYSSAVMTANIIYDKKYQDEEERRRKRGLGSPAVQFAQADIDSMKFGPGFVGVIYSKYYHETQPPYHTYYPASETVTPSKIVETWRSMDAAGKHYAVPYTWTQSFARVYRAAQKKGYVHYDAGPMAAPFLNFPPADKMPYKRREKDFLAPIISPLKLINRVVAASAQAERVNAGKVIPETSMTLELAKLYVDMTPEQKQQVLNDVLVTSRNFDELRKLARLGEFATAPTKARPEVAKVASPTLAAKRVMQGIVVDGDRPVRYDTEVRIHVNDDLGRQMSNPYRAFTDNRGKFLREVDTNGRHLKIYIRGKCYGDMTNDGSVDFGTIDIRKPIGK